MAGHFSLLGLKFWLMTSLFLNNMPGFSLPIFMQKAYFIVMYKD